MLQINAYRSVSGSNDNGEIVSMRKIYMGWPLLKFGLSILVVGKMDIAKANA